MRAEKCKFYEKKKWVYWLSQFGTVSSFRIHFDNYIFNQSSFKLQKQSRASTEMKYKFKFHVLCFFYILRRKPPSLQYLLHNQAHFIPNETKALYIIWPVTFPAREEKKNTHFLFVSRNVSNSTDILQHNALRLCEDEQFVFIICPPENNITIKVFPRLISLWIRSTLAQKLKTQNKYPWTWIWSSK